MYGIIYKVYHNLSQTIFNELFTRNNSTYNLWSTCDQISIVFKGSSLISDYGPNI